MNGRRTVKFAERSNALLYLILGRWSPMRFIRTALLLQACIAACLSQPATQHRIAVRLVNGVGEFYFRDTGAVFTPRGNNYVRLAPQTHHPGYGQPSVYHSLFNVGGYDRDDAEAQLSLMQSDGYNTVRVWLNTCCLTGIGSASGGLSPAYLANVVDFLNRAKSHGLFVLIVSDFVPEAGGYSGLVTADPRFVFPNIFYLTAGGVRAYSKYWTDVVTGLAALKAPFEAILGWEIQNELYFDSTAVPLSLTSGTVNTANGKTYDLSSVTARQAMLDDNLIYFIDQVRSSILSVDPTALVTISFFQPQAPNPTRLGDPRLIRTYPAICCSTADFIDLHPYVLDLTLAQLVQNYESTGLTSKPLIMGEYGTTLANAVSPEAAGSMLQKWQVDSCAYGFRGWLLWTWDLSNTVDNSFWAARSEGGSVDQALRPLNRPNACQAGSYPSEDLAFSSVASATNSAAGHPPSLAVDGSADSWWSAGAPPPQQIELRLARPSAIAGIRLTVSQFPDGPTIHRVYFRDHRGLYTQITEFSGTTSDKQVLSWTARAPIVGVEAVRIETVAGPSWVAWREIVVVSGDSAQPAITSVVNGASFHAGVTSGSWVSILGTGLATSSRMWESADFDGSQLPTKMDGVSVTFNGAPAALYFVSPSQLNVQAPVLAPGQPVKVVVSRDNAQVPGLGTADLREADPELFSYTASGAAYAAARFADGVVVGEPSEVPGTRPAKPGDSISLYGTGFGTSPSGAVITSASPIQDPVIVTIGGQQAVVQYAGLVGVGLFQVNVVVPNLPVGNHSAVVTFHGATSAAAPVIPVR